MDTKGTYGVIIETPTGEVKVRLRVYKHRKEYVAELWKGYTELLRTKIEDCELTEEQIKEFMESYCVEDLGLTGNYQWRCVRL